MHEDLTLTIEDTRRRAALALCDMLEEYQWHAFFTATYSRPATTPRLAIDRASRALRESYACRTFVAGERFYLGNYHAHGLAYWDFERDGQTVTDVSFYTRHSAAALSRLGFSKAEVIRDAHCASVYCAKYVSKDLTDWDFFGDWKRGLTDIGLQGKMGL